MPIHSRHVDHKIVAYQAKLPVREKEKWQSSGALPLPETLLARYLTVTESELLLCPLDGPSRRTSQDPAAVVPGTRTVTP